MKMDRVTGVAIDLDGSRVTLNLSGPTGEIAITMPVSDIESFRDALVGDGEVAVQFDRAAAAHAAEHLFRVGQNLGRFGGPSWRR